MPFLSALLFFYSLREPFSLIVWVCRLKYFCSRKTILIYCSIRLSCQKRTGTQCENYEILLSPFTNVTYTGGCLSVFNYGNETLWTCFTKYTYFKWEWIFVFSHCGGSEDDDHQATKLSFSHFWAYLSPKCPTSSLDISVKSVKLYQAFNNPRKTWI